MFEPVLPPAPSNVHRILVPAFARTLDKDYPKILRGIIQEDEYTDCIKRIEESLLYSKNFMFIPLIPFVIIVIGVILVVLTKKVYLAAIIGVGFVVFIGTAIFLYVKYSAKIKKAMEAMGKTLTDLNTKYYPSGVKWTYNIIKARGSNNNNIEFIDIIVFTPGAADAPSMDSAIITGPVASYPAAPVSKDASYPAEPIPSKDAMYPAEPAPSKDAMYMT